MRRLSGFSLMEMMVVLMIVAIIAAVSAPMMSKKAVKSAADGSPWSWVQGGTSIWFNNGTAVLGRANLPDNANNANLYIDSDLNSGIPTPHMAFAANGANPIYMTAGGNGNNIFLSTLSPHATSNASIAIGVGSDARRAGTIAIGNGARITSGGSPHDNSIAIGTDAVISPGNAGGVNSIVIGHGAKTNQDNAIAIGNGAEVGINIGGVNAVAIGNGAKAGTSSVAIGNGANAEQDNSVAIGSGVTTTGKNEIRLGDRNSRIIIPGTIELENLNIKGKLAVNGPTTLANLRVIGRSRFDSFAYFQIYGKGEPSYWRTFYMSEDVQVKTDQWFGKGSRDVQDIISDRRLKNVGKSFTAGLAEIKKLEVFNYTFKDDESKTPRVGVIAQDLQKIFPAAVVKGEDGFLRIRMEDMFYAVVNAVKELDNRISLLEQKQKQIDELQDRVDTLEKRLEALEKNK